MVIAQQRPSSALFLDVLPPFERDIREEGFQGRAGGRPCTLKTLCKIHRVYDHDCDACKQAIAGAVLPR